MLGDRHAVGPTDDDHPRGVLRYPRPSHDGVIAHPHDDLCGAVAETLLEFRPRPNDSAVRALAEHAYFDGEVHPRLEYAVRQVIVAGDDRGWIKVEVVLLGQPLDRGGHKLAFEIRLIGDGPGFSPIQHFHQT